MDYFIKRIFSVLAFFNMQLLLLNRIVIIMIITNIIIWRREMVHADWLISGLKKSSFKKFMLPARENIPQIIF